MALEEEAALPERDTRFRRQVAPQRHIRYWNAYVKSGFVRKSLYKGYQRKEIQLGRRSNWRWQDEDNREVPEEELKQPFDGDMAADDHVVYSLNKRQRWRLMDAFEDSLNDDREDEETSQNKENIPSNLDITVAAVDNIHFKSDCRRILQKPATPLSNSASTSASDSASASPQIRESVPSHRYSHLENVLTGFLRDSGEADKPREDGGRGRRRARGKRDEGQLVKTQAKTPGHSRRCNCGRCAAQPEATEWRSTARLVDEGLQERKKKSTELPVDEIRYVMEAPIPKHLVKKRGLIYEDHARSENKVVKGKRGGKSAAEMADEFEEREWSEEEEEEKEELEETEIPKAEEYSLAEWMTTKTDRRSPRLGANNAIKKTKTDVEQKDKTHIRYIEESVSSSDEEFVVVASPKSLVDAEKQAQQEEEEEVEALLPATHALFPSKAVDIEMLQRVFSDSFFEADSFPHSFVIDVSDALKDRMERDHRQALHADEQAPILLRSASEEANETTKKPRRRRNKKSKAVRPERASSSSSCSTSSSLSLLPHGQNKRRSIPRLGRRLLLTSDL